MSRRRQKQEPTETAPLEAERSTAPRIRRLSVAHAPEGAELTKPRILAGRDLVIGRDPGEGGFALDDDRASRRHTRLRYVAEYDVFRVEDLESKNGTRINGQPIESEYLPGGAVLRVGDTLLVYAESPAGPLGDRDAPPGVSLARHAAEAMADLAAQGALPVLIQGPTGVGKEVLARRIHAQSGRRGPLVAVNCATLTKELVASELFGHKKGAFSGATADREGLFAAASGGTLFLDEIAELPIEQQPALLRALQDRRIRPVGADQERETDVRLIAATHQDLEARIRAGTFREDLLGRLAGLTIRLPGLAERREEILPLFLARLGGGARLSLGAAEALLCYAWPRNIRELEHAADAVRLLQPGGEPIAAALLPEPIARATEAESAAAGAPDREALLRQLEAHGGNVAAMARAIGAHRQQVYRWLEAHAIDPAAHRKK